MRITHIIRREVLRQDLGGMKVKLTFKSKRFMFPLLYFGSQKILPMASYVFFLNYLSMQIDEMS